MNVLLPCFGFDYVACSSVMVESPTLSTLVWKAEVEDFLCYRVFS